MDNPKLLGDRPLDPQKGEADRLGFLPLGQRLAEAIVSDASSDGLVIGVEGEWGSGKSSLTALTKFALSSMSDDRRPEVVEFRPWLIGNRDALLAALFVDLRKAVDQISLRQGDATGASVTASKAAAENLRKFAARLEPVGSLVALGGMIHPAFAAAGAFLRAGAGAAKQATHAPSLAKLKRELDRALSALPMKIVIIIDDVDRLEPNEVVELLRLVRSVADFKNVVYVLCFDPTVLSEAIKIGSQIADGRSYLEKIIQVSVPVPKPEPFLLRRWFEESLQALFPNLDNDVALRLARLIDSEGGRRLNTPRTVVRALNAVSFSWAALRGQVDEADLVWLQLIRTGSPDLYRWVEEYIASMVIVRDARATVSDDAKNAELRRLEQITADDHRSTVSILADMRSHVLGIVPAENTALYNAIPDDAWQAAIRSRRLSSPEHYRLYFALDLPLLALTAEEREAYSDASSNSPAALAGVLRDLVQKRDGTGATKAEMFLEQLRARPSSELSETERTNLLLAFADVMDEVATATQHEGWLGPGGWRQARRLLPSLLTPLDENTRREVLIRMFGTGRAIGWLTDVFRDEYFAHGRFGSQAQPDSDWLMSESELDAVSTALISQFEEIGLDGLSRTYKPATAIFAWKQMGEASFASRLEDALLSDASFLLLIDMLKSHVSSTAGDYWHISADNIAALSMTKAEARDRVAGLVASSDSEIAANASNVLALMDASRW